jgi:dTDP-D-glucose 4,6-dehydratase
VPLEFAPPRPGELSRSTLAIDKAERVLGWRPQHPFEHGLSELVTWFREEAS